MTDTEHEISPERAADLIRSGEAQAIDVRTREEHEAGHLPGDRHVPLDALAGAEGALDRSRTVVFYCRSGERSGMAAEAFRASGWDAYNLAGGLLAWSEQGQPLEPEGGEVARTSGLPPR